MGESIGTMDLDNLDVDFIEDMMLKAKPLQSVLNCIRNRQIAKAGGGEEAVRGPDQGPGGDEGDSSSQASGSCEGSRACCCSRPCPRGGQGLNLPPTRPKLTFKIIGTRPCVVFQIQLMLHQIEDHALIFIKCCQTEFSVLGQSIKRYICIKALKIFGQI